MDMQPSKGPRNPDTSVGDALNAYMDDDYNDILRNLTDETSFSLLSLNNTTASRSADAIRMDSSRRYEQNIRRDS